MHLRLSRVFVFLALSALALPAYAADTRLNCAQFTRNLRVGMSGADVRELQRVLNRSSQTRVATTGPGSPGNEGTFFGTKTKLALIKFQDQNARETLNPAGLTRGNGYFGALTRKKLIQVCSGGAAAVTNNTSVTPTPTPSLPNYTVTPSSPTPPASVSEKPLPAGTLTSFMAGNDVSAPLQFAYPSDYVTKPGATINLFGNGFTAKGNTVHVGTQVFSNLSPDEFGVLSITLSKSAPKGYFDLWISNSKGESNKKFLVVKDPSVASPVVTSFTPHSGSLGTMVTVTGKGFTSSNDVYLSNHTLKGVPSSDGKTLSFKVTAEEIPGAIEGLDVKGVDKSFPFWFIIVNENGMSGGSIFTVKI